MGSKIIKTLFLLSIGILIGVSAAMGERLYFLIAALAISLFLLSLSRPFFVFLIVIFFLPFTRIGVLEIGGFSLQPSQILILCLTLTLIFQSLDKKKGIGSLTATPIDIPLLIFLMVNVLSIYQSYRIPLDYSDFTTAGRNIPFYKSITQIIWMMGGVLSYYVTVNLLRERKEIEKAIKVSLFSMGLVSAFAIYQFLGSYYNFPYAIESNILPARFPGCFSDFKHLMRGTSVSTEPSHFAIYLLSILPLCFSFIMHREYLISQRWLKTLCLLTSFGIIVTFSRAAIVCILGIIASAWLLQKKRSPFIAGQGMLKPLVPGIISIFLTLFLLNAMLTFFSFPDLIHVFKSQFITIFNPYNFSNFQRLASWGAALKMFFKHPYLGVGVGNYFMNYFYNIPEWPIQTNMPIGIKGIYMPQIVNNIFLETLCETGIFGLISFLYIFFFLLRGPLAMLKKTKDTYWLALLYGTILSFVGVLIGFFQFSAFYFPFVWTLMGLLTSVEKAAWREDENRN